ncbi:hypothetical protein MHK_002678, partial [Candidatus Magnetomorum sp. HK-1]
SENLAIAESLEKFIYHEIFESFAWLLVDEDSLCN